MPRLQRKSFEGPDRVRRLGTGHLELVDLDETSIGRVTLPPGWHWSTDVRPVVDTASCQTRHVGFGISGVLRVVMDDGTQMDIEPGDAHEIPPGHDAWVVGDAAYVGIEWAGSALYGRSREEAGDQRLATILFTDIVDSTVTLVRVGDVAWRELILQHNARLRTELDRYRGQEILTTGDGFLALFESPARAVRCAAALDPAMTDLGLRIRSGLHTGEVEIAAGNPRGLAVHAAARIAALAGPGEVLVSATTRGLVEGSDLAFEDRGTHELKGLAGARQIFALARQVDPTPAS